MALVLDVDRGDAQPGGERGQGAQGRRRISLVTFEEAQDARGPRGAQGRPVRQVERRAAGAKRVQDQDDVAPAERISSDSNYPFMVIIVV